MKLTLVSPIYPPDIGGPATFIPALAEAAMNREVATTVVAITEDPDTARTNDWDEILISRERGRLTRFLETVYAIGQCARNSDIVFANGLAFQASLACWLARTPLVIKVVGDIAWERAVLSKRFHGTLDEFRPKTMSCVDRYWAQLRTIPAKLSDRIVVPSEYLKGIVNRWGINENKISVIPNGIRKQELFRHSPGLKTEKCWKTDNTRLLAIGRLVPWKRLEELVRVVSELGNVELLIVGDGPSYQSIQSEIQSHPTNRVRMVGRKPRGQLGSLLTTADIFVLNSTYEGLPHCVLEAMEVGCPVVASAAGGTPELIDDEQTGILYEPGQPGELKEALCKLVGSPSLRKEIATNAQRSVREHYSFSAMVNSTIDLLTAIDQTNNKSFI